MRHLHGKHNPGLSRDYRHIQTAAGRRYDLADDVYAETMQVLKGVTTGEGRIVATVMFAEGLLLWFLRER